MIKILSVVIKNKEVICINFKLIEKKYKLLIKFYN